MNQYKILTQYSLWWLPLCALLGLAYAYLMYQKRGPWSKRVNYTLATIRFVFVTLLALLLLGPMIKYFNNTTEKPRLVFAVDNSQSIAYATDSARLKALKADMSRLKESLEAQDMVVELKSLSEATSGMTPEALNFNVPFTNLSGLMKDVQNTYENRNLVGMVLFSDGIYNQGMAPLNLNLALPVYTVGLGDTTQRKDVALRSVQYNKITYLGNKFPVVVELESKGYPGASLKVQIRQGTTILDEKTLQVKSPRELLKADFLLSADQKGIQHYVVEILPLRDEFTLRNNTAHAYVEVIDNREKILLVAPAPHPDIRAIRTAIEQKENYEFVLHIPGITEYKEDKYDVVIFHQLPDQAGTVRNLIDKFTRENTPIWFILGPQTNLNVFNTVNKVLTISTRQNQRDQVTPIYNPSFQRFKTEASDNTAMSFYPPISVPFGDYTLKQEAEVILHQKIGNTATTRPLLVTSGDRRQAVLCGEGIWQWRMYEYKERDEFLAFDKLITNTLQYLSTKEDKRKFRVYPIKNEFDLHEQVFFETEIYNDIYEKIYGQKIDLKITGEKSETTTYSYINGESNSRFEVRGLKPGVYRYVAATVLNGKPERSEGTFVITEMKLEALNTTADHEMLKGLASSTEAQFYLPAAMQQLTEDVKKKKFAGIIHTNEEMVDLINLPWLFFVILGLASTEWFVRKYKGGY